MLSFMRLFLAASLFCVLAGCTQMTAFYPNSTALPLNSVQHKPGYDLAFIEFGEQGSYQDPLQVENARNLIQKTARPLVVTYVHGWQNNATSGDSQKFGAFLQQLSESSIVREANFHVVGVYLGWRGQLTKVPVAKEMTFFSRKAAAERLASNFDCYDAIATVSETARKYHAADAQYTILVGHSFGGLVVERSVAHAINAEIHGRATDPAKALPADLILLLNPASDSVLTRQMIAALYSRHLEGTREFIVSLTSTADDATGVAFPAGTNLSALSKGFNEVRVPGPDANLTASERRFYTSTPGHNPLLINHKVTDLHKTLAGNGKTAFENNLSHHALAGRVFETDDGAGGLKLWQFTKVGAVDVPYWDVEVDPEIIKDHGDIWNERARAMMAAVFRLNIPGRAALTRQSAVAPAAAKSASPENPPKPDLQRPPDFQRLATPQKP